MSTFWLHTARALTPTAEIPSAGILVRDGVIEAIGPRQDMSLPAGAQEISAVEQTAIPGFVDAHIHRAGGLGVHYEGPFLNKARRGVHPTEWLQLPSTELLERLLQSASGNARILTLAPE